MTRSLPNLHHPDLDLDLSDLGRRRPLTLASDETSPTAINHFRDKWHSMIQSGFKGSPKVICDLIEYEPVGSGAFTFYLIIMLHPTPSSGFQVLGRVHSTLARVRYRGMHYGDPTAKEVVAAFNKEVRDALQILLEAVYIHSEPQPPSRHPSLLQMGLAPPPWRKSWTFGVPSGINGLFSNLVAIFHTWRECRFPNRGYILPEREFHISWN
jgi:hypothetical protein